MTEIITSPDLLKVYVDSSDPKREFYLPERLDLMVTGACAMRCAGCWGPKHNSLDPELTPEQWMEIVRYVDINNRAIRYNYDFLASDNATVCITGGEPLLYPGILGLIDLLHKSDVKTTLSTTGIDPKDLLPKVLPKIRELGVPLDGPTPDTNRIWRKGKLDDGGYRAAVQAVKLAQERFPEVEVTLRTLLHPNNLTSIPDIPNNLKDEGIETNKLNWKFYIFNPNTGPRQGESDISIVQDDIDRLAEAFEDNEPDFKSAAILLPRLIQNRLIVNHDGKAHIILPTDSGYTKDVPLDNIATDPTNVIRTINNDYLNFLASACRRCAEHAFLNHVNSAGEAGSANPMEEGIKEYQKRIAQVRA